MKHRPVLFCILTLVTLAASLGVQAQPRVYFSGGVNFGQTDTYYGLDLAPITLARDFTDIGIRVSVGVELGPWLGFEAGWADLGSTSGTAELISFCPGGCPPGTPPEILDLKSSASTFWAAYAPSFDHGRWRIHAAVGAASVRRELRVQEPWLSQTSTELLLGVGATLDLTDRTGIRLDLQRFGDVSSAVGVSATIRIR